MYFGVKEQKIGSKYQASTGRYVLKITPGSLGATPRVQPPASSHPSDTPAVHRRGFCFVMLAEASSLNPVIWPVACLRNLISRSRRYIKILEGLGALLDLERCEDQTFRELVGQIDAHQILLDAPLFEQVFES